MDVKNLKLALRVFQLLGSCYPRVTMIFRFVYLPFETKRKALI